ncbi:MAG: hypothetical protein HW387_262 [Parachlamydiales bacterium]|nr:hypothetical protein [Parachlamydiales bacterium]
MNPALSPTSLTTYSSNFAIPGFFKRFCIRLSTLFDRKINQEIRNLAKVAFSHLLKTWDKNTQIYNDNGLDNLTQDIVDLAYKITDKKTDNSMILKSAKKIGSLILQNRISDLFRETLAKKIVDKIEKDIPTNESSAVKEIPIDIRSSLPTNEKEIIKRISDLEEALVLNQKIADTHYDNYTRDINKHIVITDGITGLKENLKPIKHMPESPTVISSTPIGSDDSEKNNIPTPPKKSEFPINLSQRRTTIMPTPTDNKKEGLTDSFSSSTASNNSVAQQIETLEFENLSNRNTCELHYKKYAIINTQIKADKKELFELNKTLKSLRLTSQLTQKKLSPPPPLKIPNLNKRICF